MTMSIMAVAVALAAKTNITMATIGTTHEQTISIEMEQDVFG